jgi:serine/threonine protein kinase
MSKNTHCPELPRLEGLLGDRLTGNEREALTEHLGACTNCQQALDRLAGGPDPERLLQAERGRPAKDSAYWAAVARLENDVTRLDVREQARATGLSLDFLTPSEDPETIGMLDHFAIKGVVGRGGMGLVLRGFDTWLNREVAVKVLDPALAQDENAQHRFCRESRAAASISHEHVVAVHHVAESESNELPYLVMQLIDGESLEEILAREGRLELKEIVRIGKEIAEGLAAAHAKGLIHRDVKPANVLMERGTGRVKLTDFGLARAAEDVRLTRSGLVAGTPLYMAPEQARGEEVDHRTDLFSLGVLLYELCTGRTPFEAKTPLAVMKKLTEEKHLPIRELRSDAPMWLVEVIDRLLAKSPRDRFQSAREVADLLDQFYSAMKTSSDVVPVCPHKRRKRLIQGLALLAAVVSGAIVTASALLLWRGRGDPSPPDNSPPPQAVLRGNSGTVWGVAFSPDDKTLAMGIEDGTIKLWDLEANSVRATLTGHRASVWSSVFSQDGKLLVTSSDDNTARVWDLAKNTTVKTLPASAAMRMALFGRDGVYTGDRGGNVRVWDLPSGKELRSWQHRGSIFTLALSPDGKTVATGGSNRVIRLQDSATGQERLLLTGHAGPVYGVAYRPDGKMLASGGWDHIIRLWDTATGDLLRSLDAPSRDVWSVAFAPDGKTLASVGQDGIVRVWDAETGGQLAALKGHDGAVHTVVFSTDGSRIASGGRDGTVHLWEAIHTGR